MRVLMTIIVVIVTLHLSATIINIPADQPTIQAGIDVAVDNDIILVQPGTYIENIDYDGKSIILASLFYTTQDTSYISQTIIDGNQNGSVVKFDNGETSDTELVGFTLQNGSGQMYNNRYHGGGVYCSNASPSLRHLIISNNTASNGGGFAARSSSSPFLEKIIIKNNYVNNDGGGIWAKSSNVTIEDVDIFHNTAEWWGGGVFFNESSSILTNTQIINNSAFHSGGGICCWESYPFLSNVDIKYNTAPSGGGFTIFADSLPVFSNTDLCTIYLNNANSRECGSDFYTNQNDNYEVFVDTFTVSYPSSFHAYPIENYEFDIECGILPRINADLYISPEGDNNNTGTSVDDPLKTIHYACSVIIADSLNTHTIYLSNGIYSTSSNGEYFPISLPEYVSLVGESENGVILDAENQKRVMTFVNSNEVSVSNLTLKNGFALIGGGIDCRVSSPDFANITISDCYAEYGGGLSCRHGDSNPSFENVEISNNTAEFDGGGVYCYYTELYMNEVIIRNNSTLEDNGGGIYCEESEIILHNMIIENNSSEAAGGGIYFTLSDMVLHQSEVLGNTAVLNGGGLSLNDAFPNFSSMNIKDVEICDNSSDKGGGIYLNDFSPTIDNVIIAYNSSSVRGGGIYCYDDSNPIIRNSTFYANTASSDGLALTCVSNCDAILINSIINNENQYPISSAGYAISLISIAYSNIQGGENAIYNGCGSYAWLEGNIDLDPFFVNPEEWNFHLTENSPCIDSGTAFYELNGEVVIDLAENEYYGIAPDMGAYEWQETSIENDELSIANYKLNNFPNPFNPSTTIEFSIQNESIVDISIYNIKGQRIRSLLNNQITAGEHSIVWNGKDDSNNKVGSGVYLYKLKVNSKTEAVKKGLLLK
jgi:predicted outer membrane repeat protein